MTIIFMLIKDDHHPLTCFLYSSSSSASAEEAGRSLGTVGNSQHEKWCSNLAAYFARYALSLACRETRRENVLGFAFDLLLLLPFPWCSAYLSGPGCVCWWHRRTIFFFLLRLVIFPFTYHCICVWVLLRNLLLRVLNSLLSLSKIIPCCHSSERNETKHV